MSDIWDSRSSKGGAQAPDNRYEGRSAMSIVPGLGPIAIEADSTTQGLRVIEYACREARESGADLLLVRPYRETVPNSPMMPLSTPADLRDAAVADLRVAMDHACKLAGEVVDVRGIVL